MIDILCYGTGRFAEFFMSQKSNEWNVVGFVETEPNDDAYLNEYHVYSLKQIPNVKYDKIFITNTYVETLENLLELGIKKENIVICNYKVYTKYANMLSITLVIKTRVLS